MDSDVDWVRSMKQEPASLEEVGFYAPYVPIITVKNGFKRRKIMSKPLQFILAGLVGGIVGGVIDVITGKAGAAIVIFGIVIIVGGIVGYFLNRNR